MNAFRGVAVYTTVTTLPLIVVCFLLLQLSLPGIRFAYAVCGQARILRYLTILPSIPSHAINSFHAIQVDPTQFTHLHVHLNERKEKVPSINQKT